jgi:spoIIIJ-associated protein
MELEAKNVEKAVEIACDKFNLSPQELQYDVISYGSSGIFGLGKTRNAKIRVVIPNSVPPALHGTDDYREPNRNGNAKARVQDLIQETLREPGPDAATDFEQRKGQAVLQQIVDAITEGATVAAQNNGNRIHYQVKGGNSGLLIGKHGQTLQAMQSLIDKVINRNAHRRVRVQVDVEGYLENRHNNLRRHALRMAQKCKRIGKPVIVGTMNAHDRRIVHLTLKNDRDVRTNSSGEGFARKLTVFPSKSMARSRRRDR